jgi:cell division protein FtsZ
MTVTEAEKAAELVSARISPSARMIWGCSVDPNMDGLVRVMAVLTGVKGGAFMSSRDLEPKSKHGVDLVR